MQGLADGRGAAAFQDGFGPRPESGSPVGAGARVPAGQDPLPKLGSATKTLDGMGGLGWSVIGFLIGAVFWHFVGFWGFVSDVVLAGNARSERIVVAERLAADRPVAPRAEAWVVTTESASAPAEQPACISLVLDRRSGRTSAAACADGGGPLPADTFEGREDRIGVSASADAWVAPHGPPSALGIKAP